MAPDSELPGGVGLRQGGSALVPSSVPAPLQGPPLGERRVRPLLLLGAHGGAGVSTLAAMLQPAFDAGVVRNWGAFTNPQRHPLAIVTGWTVPASGQAVAQVAAAVHAGMPPRVLIVVGDGWPQPRAARVRFRLLEAQVGTVVYVPFVRGWRYLDHPAPPVPSPVLRALERIQAAVYGPLRR